ncbi:MAG TPA: hypothetical protein VKG92_09415 [Flavobacteriales bacterium]|nr:hypothetical protein [Flavobacteriales bacterium]
MQQIVFAIAHFLEMCLSLLVKLGWLPVTLFTVTMFLGFVYWLNLQGRYNRRAKHDNTLA